MVSFSIISVCVEINYILKFWKFKLFLRNNRNINKLKIILMISFIFKSIILIDTKHWNSRESVNLLYKTILNEKK
jgi:hypothetical protein